MGKVNKRFKLTILGIMNPPGGGGGLGPPIIGGGGGGPPPMPGIGGGGGPRGPPGIGGGGGGGGPPPAMRKTEIGELKCVMLILYSICFGS